MCGAINSQGLSYVVRGCRPPQGFFLCDNSFQPRNVLQQALAGQDEKVITELRILKVDFEQLFISYGHHLPVLDAFDGRGSPLIGSKETKFAHETSRRKFDADFRDQKLSCDRQEHFVSCIILLEQCVAPAIFSFGHERLEPFP